MGATSQSQTNFGSFLIGTLAFSIALAVIRDISKSVFICILLHCMINASFDIAGVVMGFKSNMITLLISLLIYLVYSLLIRKAPENSLKCIQIKNKSYILLKHT